LSNQNVARKSLMSTYTPEEIEAAFAASRAEFIQTVTWLANDTDGSTHGEIGVCASS
jgi:hypothetical protein